MQRFRLEYVPFPADLRGVTGLIGEKAGRYVILIDSNQDSDTQKHALRHELAHLAYNHMEFARTPSEAIASADLFPPGWEQRERDADRYADTMTDEEFLMLMKYAI